MRLSIELGHQRCLPPDRGIRRRINTAYVSLREETRSKRLQLALLTQSKTVRLRDRERGRSTCISASKDTASGIEVPASTRVFQRTLTELLSELSSHDSSDAKIRLLKTVPECHAFLKKHSEWFVRVTADMSVSGIYVLFCIVAMGQAHVLVNEDAHPVIYAPHDQLTLLIENLLRLEKFYDSLGGLLGYQLKSLELLSNDTEHPDASVEYLLPAFLDIGEGNISVRTAVRSGIEGIPFMAEIYALGGSGDRLGLQCPESGDLLPSAMLPYCGRSMLDSMIRDLQAREALYFKLTGRQLITPIVIMTSDAKDNDHRIKEMLRSQNWYERGEEAFFIFKQPLVPLLDTVGGSWLVSYPGKIIMRPGGHGVIWKLMWDEGVFEWLKTKQRKAAILRQVSNPLASTDTTLFALSGLGLAQNKSMGFASCERVVGASEGMNVVQHRHIQASNGGSVHEYGITNIEYTEFERLGLTDVAIGDGSSTSCFPANTNILYVSLDAAQRAVEKRINEGGFVACLPGLIFNKKKKIQYEDERTGEIKKCLAGRMECMMQNLADSLSDVFTSELASDDLSIDNLSTFMVSNIRRKVTSSAKRKYRHGGSIRQTPEGSFWDLMLNARDILKQSGMDVPQMGTVEEYLHRGPSFIFLFHPALGPLWSIITQKIKGGRMSKGSELVLELSDARIENLNLDGSLIILSDSPISYHASTAASKADDVPDSNQGIVPYSNKIGHLFLKNVEVQNAGIEWEHHENVYWQHEVHRGAYCMIRLHGCSEFIAKDVKIAGNHTFEVPDGFQLHLIADPDSKTGFKEILKVLPNSQPSWNWQYRFVNDDVELSC